MESINITMQNQNLEEIKNLYHRAFPKNEQMLFWFLLWKTRKNNVDFLALYDNKEFIGFVYLIHNKDITFVHYFAICEHVRSKGYGSKILGLLRDRYVNNRIALNIEAP